MLKCSMLIRFAYSLYLHILELVYELNDLQAIDETIKYASGAADQKLKEANTYVDGKRQEIEKVRLV